MSIIFHWLIGALALFIAAKFVPGISVTAEGALIGSLVLALLNLFVKPIISILTLPINIITLGLFSLVINALIILIAAHFVPGFLVAGFVSALLLSIVLSIVNIFFGTEL